MKTYINKIKEIRKQILAENIKNIRIKKDKTQQEVADLLGINRVSYQSKESGNAYLTAIELFQLHIIFNIDIQELYKNCY